MTCLIVLLNKEKKIKKIKKKSVENNCGKIYDSHNNEIIINKDIRFLLGNPPDKGSYELD